MHTDPGEVPATTPALAGALALGWLDPPSAVVLRAPADRRLRLVNIGQRTLQINRSRDAVVVLLAPDGGSVAPPAPACSRSQ